MTNTTKISVGIQPHAGNACTSGITHSGGGGDAEEEEREGGRAHVDAGEEQAEHRQRHRDQPQPRHRRTRGAPPPRRTGERTGDDGEADIGGINRPGPGAAPDHVIRAARPAGRPGSGKSAAGSAQLSGGPRLLQRERHQEINAGRPRSPRPPAAARAAARTASHPCRCGRTHQSRAAPPPSPPSADGCRSARWRRGTAPAIPGRTLSARPARIRCRTASPARSRGSGSAGRSRGSRPGR